MQAVHAEIQARKLIAQRGRGELGVAEHHHALVALADHQLCQIPQLVAVGCQQLILGDLGHTFQLGLHGHLGGIVLIQPADVHHFAADGGAEHGKAFAVFHQVNDMPHILVKAHVQHFVGFVQHHGFHGAHINGAALVMVHQAARRGHNDLAALLQLFGLPLHICAAIQARNAHLGHKLAQILQLGCDLLCQLTGGGQDHCLRHLFFFLDALDHRNAEGTGFARARGGLGDHIVACHH